MASSMPLLFLLLAGSLGSCSGRVQFLQRHHTDLSHTSHAPLLRIDSKQSKCTSLANHGTYFTVDVMVGTPPQTFAVVADTGSNDLIVPSCVCMDNNRCDKRNRCFRGTNRSSSFSLEDYKNTGPMGMLITFGSGQVQTVIATDVAEVGGVNVIMNNSLLLMTDQALAISSPFEGILGLGMPRTKSKARPSALDGRQHGSQQGAYPFAGEGTSGSGTDIQHLVDEILKNRGGASGGDMKARSAILLERLLDEVPGNESAQPWVPAQADVQPKSFLEEAGITRFSMCFKEGANGTLHLDTPPEQDVLESVGQVHWAVDLNGISVGNQSVSVPICSRATMTEGQQTACAAIPDSGTTAIMAPKEHIGALMETICDGWARCRDNHSAFLDAQQAAHKIAAEKYDGVDPFGIDKLTIAKADVLKLVLQDCGTWMTDEQGLNELPSLDFHVAGKTGKKRTLQLSGWAYVMESEVEIVHKVYKDFGTLGKVPVGVNKTGRTETVCSLAFGEMDYNTQANGPVWILGTPFFYAYQVGYDLDPASPSISFTSIDKAPCDPCGPSFVESGVDVHAGGVISARRPRQVKGPWRVPSLDVNEPL